MYFINTIAIKAEKQKKNIQNLQTQIYIKNLNILFPKQTKQDVLSLKKLINSQKLEFQHYLHYNQKTILPYNAQHFFQVVYQVEKYHQFLPWCSNSVIHKRNGFSYFEAELFINFRVYQDSYLSKVTSDICKNNYQIVSLSNNISAFKKLQSTWNIKPISDNTCQIDYHIDFEFKNLLYQTAAQMFLDNVIKKINTSFEKRVQELQRQNYFENNKLTIFETLQKEQQQQSLSNNETITNNHNLNESEKVIKESESKQTNNNILYEKSILQNNIENNIIKNKISHEANKQNQQNVSTQFHLKKQIEDHINQLVQQNIAQQDEAQIFMKTLVKSPEQQELIVNAYKFFILNKGLINMNEEQANWKFLSFLRSTTLYK